MKKVIILSAISCALILMGWMAHRTEVDFGRVLNDQGDGKLYNGEPFYNYCCYDTDRFHENDIVLTVCLLNPFNTYCDDILLRYDFTVLKNVI